MGMKYLILLLMVLCVLFIIVQELYQSHSSRWNSPRSRLVAAPMLRGAESFQYSDQILPAQETIRYTEDRAKGDWVEDDEVDHRRSNNYNRGGGHDEDDGRVWNMKRWKDWKRKVNVDKKSSIPESTKRPRNGKKNMKRVWEDDEGDLDEEERLRKSPYIFHEEQELERLNSPVIEHGVKYFSSFMEFEIKQNKKHSFRKCRYKSCEFIDDATKADLVTFRAATIRDYNISTFPRSPGQRWLMYTIDPAIRGYRLGEDAVKSLFNATMTYSLDADITQLFGRLRRVPPLNDVDYDAIYDGKSKTVAWFVSHCETPSKREEYLKQMQRVLDVDVYGECGKLSCGGGKHSRSNDEQTCLPLLTKHYKFYLAFENAFCQDYLTEKFFKLFQRIQVIPVVRGGFQYRKYLPSGIFVNADNFESAEALSEYLIELGNDKKRYIEMLKLKDQWEFVSPEYRECLLCEYLHSNPPAKFYPNLQEKFGRHSCWYPKNL